MSILVLMIPVTIVFSLVFIVGFLWAVRSGQFDDLETPAHRLLMEPEPEVENNLEREKDEQQGTDSVGVLRQ